MEILFIFICYLTAVRSDYQVVGGTPICFGAQFRFFRERVKKNPFPINICDLNLLYKNRTCRDQTRGAGSNHHSTVSIIPISDSHRNCKDESRTIWLRLKGQLNRNWHRKMKKITCHISKGSEVLGGEPKPLATGENVCEWSKPVET